LKELYTEEKRSEEEDGNFLVEKAELFCWHLGKESCVSEATH
jgi:hypothetical protein